MQGKTIMLSCPIHNRSWILSYYLDSVFNIDYPKNLITIYWLVNNCTDDSQVILESFKSKHKHLYRDIIIEVRNSPKSQRFIDDRSFKVRNQFTYHWLSELRNSILSKCVKLNCQYLFSSDSDILLQPNVLKGLLDANKHVTAALIYNGHLVNPTQPWKYPNAMVYRTDNLTKQIGIGGLAINVQISKDEAKYKPYCDRYIRNPKSCDENVLIPVDLSGACILVSQEVCKVSIFESCVEGEDATWSESVIKAGYKIYLKPSLFQHHIMSKELLQEYLESKNK